MGPSLERRFDFFLPFLPLLFFDLEEAPGKLRKLNNEEVFEDLSLRADFFDRVLLPRAQRAHSPLSASDRSDGSESEE